MKTKIKNFIDELIKQEFYNKYDYRCHYSRKLLKSVYFLIKQDWDSVGVEYTCDMILFSFANKKSIYNIELCESDDSVLIETKESSEEIELCYYALLGWFYDHNINNDNNYNLVSDEEIKDLIKYLGERLK